MFSLIRGILKNLIITTQIPYHQGLPVLSDYLPDPLPDLYRAYYERGTGFWIQGVWFFLASYVALFTKGWQRWAGAIYLVTTLAFWITPQVWTLRATSFPISFLYLPIPKIPGWPICLVLLSTALISYTALRPQLRPFIRRFFLFLCDALMVLLVALWALPFLTGEVWLPK